MDNSFLDISTLLSQGLMQGRNISEEDKNGLQKKSGAEFFI